MRSKTERKFKAHFTYKWLIYLGIIIMISYIFLLIHDLFISYPLLSSNRDWLNIFADIGQLLSGLAIVGIIFEIYRYLQNKREEDKKRIPKINIGRTILIEKSIPKDGVICLNESNRNELPNLGPSLEFGSYREMWISMGPPTSNNNRYLKVDVTNQQSFTESNIISMQLEIRLRYWDPHSGQAAISATIWCPYNGFDLQVGKSISLYIRCGELTDKNLKKISGEIVDYKCVTAGRDTFYGKTLNFEKINIPEQDLCSDEVPA